MFIRISSQRNRNKTEQIFNLKKLRRAKFWLVKIGANCFGAQI